MKHEAGWPRLWAVVRRRRWPVILTTIGVAAVGLYLVSSMDSMYQARAVVRIDDPRPSRDYVSPLTSEPDADRLKSARMGFVAQPVIAEAAEKVRLLPPPDDKDRALVLGRVSQRVDARQEGEDTFIVTYDDPQPDRAQAFLANLLESYTKIKAAEIASRAAATAAYLAKQLDEMRPRIAQVEATLEKARVEHYGALPEQLEGNLRILDNNEVSIHALMTSLDAAESRRRDILADVESPLRHQEEAVARDLSAARTRYAANAPEVKNLQAELDRIRQDRLAEESAAGKRAQSSSELRTIDGQIARTKGEIAAAQNRGKDIRGRIEAAAKNGESMAQMVLDRDVMRERLKALIGKHEEAALAAGLEAGVNGRSRVTVVEPPWTSAQPVKPSKPLFALGAIALAIAVGLGVGFLLDGLDRRVLATEDVRAFIGDLPILGVVPRIGRVGRAANGNNYMRAFPAAGSET